MAYGVKLGFIGAGRMGDALIRAFVRAAEVKPSHIYAYNRSDYKLRNLKTLGVQICKSNKEVEQMSDIVFICVKPDQVEDVVYDIKGSEKLIVSIAAGIRLAYLQKNFKKALRVMPNVAVQVDEAAVAYTPGKHITKQEKDFIEKIFSCVGIVVETNEKDLGSITALSGSGPGFLAYYIYAFVRAAQNHGLKKEVATKLVVQTVIGAGKMLRDLEISPGELIAMVASPGGVTESGLAVLQKRKFESIIDQAFMVSKEKSRKLGQQKNWNPSYIR